MVAVDFDYKNRPESNSLNAFYSPSKFRLRKISCNAYFSVATSHKIRDVTAWFVAQSRSRLDLHPTVRNGDSDAYYRRLRITFGYPEEDTHLVDGTIVIRCWRSETRRVVPVMMDAFDSTTGVDAVAAIE